MTLINGKHGEELYGYWLMDVWQYIFCYNLFIHMNTIISLLHEENNLNNY